MKYEVEILWLCRSLLTSFFLLPTSYFLLYPSSFCLSSEDVASKRTYAHLYIGDPRSACEEAKHGLVHYPRSEVLHRVLVRACAEAGDEPSTLQAWREYSFLFPEAIQDRETLEIMAWGMIQQGTRSSSPIVRLTALLGAFLGNDAKGVEILHKGMNDGNSFVRGAAVQLSSKMRDETLSDEVVHLLEREKVWSVRLEVIKALGEMKRKDMRTTLETIVADDTISMEERVAAIQALVSLFQSPSREELERLTRSSRAGFRQLACELIFFFDLAEDSDLMVPLLRDHRPEVRATALEVLGRMRIQKCVGERVDKLVMPLLKDPDFCVAITAAWVLLLHDSDVGQKVLAMWCRHGSSEVRLFAAATLGASGKYGLSLMRQAFEESDDPYVRLNIALGLISQRIAVPDACEALFQGITTLRENWCWKQQGGFRILGPVKILGGKALESPWEVDQLTRLEVLNILALMKDPKAQEALKHFLRAQKWGISAVAAGVLLTEGDDEALELVKKLLEEDNAKVRFQAALILSLWGKDEAALEVLYRFYPTADREMKERILEGVGRVGVDSSVPFLVSCLSEPYQTLRIIAACALIQCLNQ